MSGVIIDQLPAEGTVVDNESPVLASGHILVIRHGGIKDFIQALAPMDAIKRHHPDARITLLTTKEFVDIASRSGYFDEILIDKKPDWYQPEEWFDLYKCLNATRFTRVYDLQMDSRTWVYYRLFRRKPVWVGLIKPTPFFYDRAHDNMPQMERYRAVLYAGGIEQMGLPDLGWMRVDVDFFGLKRPVLLVPGGDYGSAVRYWSPLKYAALALKFTRNGYDVAILGTVQDREITEKIRALCPDAKDLTEQASAYDIASLSERARCVVGNNSSAVHLAALMKAPVIVMMSGEDDPMLAAPAGQDVTVIQAPDLDDISVGDVYAAFQKRRVADDAKTA